MKKMLLFYAATMVYLALPSYGQSNGPNVGNSGQSSAACDLNLTNNLPSVNAQCSVEYADLVIPVITDSCGNTVTPTTDTSIFPVSTTGTTTITWSYVNELGGIETQFQNINILDSIIPVVDVAILPNFHSQCAVHLADLPVPTAMDNCSGVLMGTTNAVFPITVSTLITWNYTDATGNIRFQTQDIYINDFTEPIPDAAVLPNVHALCQVEVTDVAVPTATDNCGGLVTVTNNATFPIVRSTLITWTYTDVNGNESYQTQDIYIDDFTLPVADAASLPDVHALCQVDVADLAVPTATDNCTSPVIVTNDATFPIVASTVITWTFSDASGNITTQTQNIIIDDVTSPIPDVAVLADVVSQCALSATDLIAPTASDNCTVASVTNDGVFPIAASTTITWTYTDNNGNSVTQTQNIAIADTTAPTPDVAVLADVTGQCEVLQADVVAPTATDNCSGIVTVTNDGIFPITVQGATTITWTYTDASGNTATQTQNVLVNDTITPVADVAVLADITAQCEVLEADVVAPTVTDNCSVVIVSNDASFPITATTTITWTYKDASGNTSMQTQNVIINDTTAPTPDAAVLADVIAQCEVLATDLTAPTATDNCSGIVTVTNDGVFPITASATLTWTYTDANGNDATQTQNIVINDTTAPTPDAATLTDVSAQCEVLATDLTVPTVTDNCAGIVTVTNDGVFPITASTTITWTYTDGNSNTATQSQNIVISDTIAPTPDAATLADITASCEVLPTDVIAPTATDNCSGIVTVTNDALFPINISSTIVWTYTDANGNTATQNQMVIINDTAAPTPDAATLADITAQCEVLATDVTSPTATDNCSGIVTVTNDGIFPITASTTITWTYTDANGNTATQTQSIIINDNTAPTPDTAVLADIVSQCSLLEADVIAPTATDNCSGIITVTNDAVFPITGSTTITWTYTDARANSVTQTQNITINADTTAPTPNAALLADIIAQCEVLEADVNTPTATDNCTGIVTVTNDGVFPITASTTITWTYEDASGNTSTQTQNVIVNDTTAPTADAATLADITAQCEVVEADVVAPTATDNCSAIAIVTNDAVFPITASTTITWTYTDADGNSSTQLQNVIVNDTTAPTPDAALLADVTGSCEVVEADVIAPTATDNCSGIVTVTNDGIFPIGVTTTITWTYTDANGNNATQTQNIVINDATAPTPDAASLADITAQCEVLASDVTSPTATDNCSVVSVTNDGIFPITASTTMTWTYTDANGNTATQTQNIVINDSTAPTPDATTLADIIGQCEVLEADITAPTATDNCSVVIVSNDATFPIATQGTTTITWTYTDGNGNSTTQTQNVVIGDDTAPTFSLADITVSVNVAGTVTVTAADFGTISDNCGIASVSVLPDTFTCTELGIHSVIITAIDIHGNVATHTATVTVADPTDFCGALGIAHNEKGAFAIYPNPTSDMVHVEGTNHKAVYSIKLYSLTGQLVLQQAYNQNAERYSISLSSLPQGTYLLKLETAEGISTKTVIKY